MKKTIFTLAFIGLSVISNAQVGAMATFDAAQAANMGTSISQTSEVIAKGAETVSKLEKTYKQLEKQAKFVADVVEKVDDGLKTMSVINDIQKNVRGVYDDYQVAIIKLDKLKEGNLSNENVEYVDSQIAHVLVLLQKNNETASDFTSILKDDFLKMETSDRMKFLDDINKKILSVRLSIRGTALDTSKRLTAERRKGEIYSMPTLK